MKLTSDEYEQSESPSNLILDLFLMIFLGGSLLKLELSVQLSEPPLLLMNFGFFYFNFFVDSTDEGESSDSNNYCLFIYAGTFDFGLDGISLLFCELP